MDLHRLKTLYSAVNTGSFTRTSRELHLLQSTISRHIEQLERGRMRLLQSGSSFVIRLHWMHSVIRQ
jgi:DNA-binding transcriptional LysR family regulator